MNSHMDVGEMVAVMLRFIFILVVIYGILAMFYMGIRIVVGWLGVMVGPVMRTAPVRIGLGLLLAILMYKAMTQTGWEWLGR